MIKCTDKISYCPKSGYFFYTKNTGKMRAGEKAGHVSLVNTKRNISYVKLRIDGRYQLAHRVAATALGFDIFGFVVDHINGDTLDNREINLRVCTQADNNKNLSHNCRSKTGLNGVYLKNGKFYARVTVNKKNIHLGVFDNIFDAACARKAALHKNNFHANHGRM